jgi:MFS family permease
MAAFSSYFIIPYYVIFLRDQIGIPVLSISFLIMVTSMLERGITLPAGMLADKIGAKKIAISGVMLRCVSLLALSVTTQFSHFLAVAILSGIGSACFSVGGKKAMLDMTGNDVKVFSLRSLAINVGISSGPVLGYLLIGYNFRTLCFYNAMAYVFIAFIYLYLITPRDRNKDTPVSLSVIRQIGGIIRNRKVTDLFLIQILFFFTYTFLDSIFPLYASQHVSMLAVGLTFTVNSIVVLIINLMISKYVDSIKSPLAFGFLFFSLSFLSIFISSRSESLYGFYLYLLGIVFFSFAEIFFMIMTDVRAIQAADKNQYGTVMGAMGFVAMIGVGAGNITNGGWYGLLNSKGAVDMFWLMAACMSVFFFLIGLYFSRKNHKRVLG